MYLETLNWTLKKYLINYSFLQVFWIKISFRMSSTAARCFDIMSFNRSIPSWYDLNLVKQRLGDNSVYYGSETYLRLLSIFSLWIFQQCVSKLSKRIHTLMLSKWDSRFKILSEFPLSRSEWVALKLLKNKHVWRFLLIRQRLYK